MNPNQSPTIDIYRDGDNTFCHEKRWVTVTDQYFLNFDAIFFCQISKILCGFNFWDEMWTLWLNKINELINKLTKV